MPLYRIVSTELCTFDYIGTRARSDESATSGMLVSIRTLECSSSHLRLDFILVDILRLCYTVHLIGFPGVLFTKCHLGLAKVS